MDEIKIVQYLQINRIIDEPERKSEVAEDNVRKAEIEFMADLKTLVKETARDRDLIATTMGLEKRDNDMIPDDYFRFVSKLSARFGILFMDDKVIVPKTMREWVLNAPHFGHPGLTKMVNDSRIFWWPGILDDIHEKHRNCTACINAGKNLKTQLPKTEKSKILTAKEPGEELQLDFTGKIFNEKITGHPQILVAVDHFSKWPTAKICSNTETKTVTKFLENYFNLYGIPKTIRTDNDTAFTSREFKTFCEKYKIRIITGLPYMHTATGLVERNIQTLEGLLLANLQDGNGLEESLNRALWVMRFTVHTNRKMTPFEMHFGRKPRTVLTNTLDTRQTLLSNWNDICISENPTKLPVYTMRDKNGNLTDHIVMARKKSTVQTP